MIYSVNMRTKEHRQKKWGDENTEDEWKVVLADADGWIPWHGGECPLPDGHPVDVRYRCGEKRYDVPANKLAPFGMDASVSFWKKDGSPYDIIAYSPILDAKPELAWDGSGLPPVGCECEYRRPWGWEEAKVIGYDGSVCVVAVDGEGYFGNLTSGAFRPIRSEEDKAVDVMIQRAGLDDADYNRAVCRDIYRAGYRKT